MADVSPYKQEIIGTADLPLASLVRNDDGIVQIRLHVSRERFEEILQVVDAINEELIANGSVAGTRQLPLSGEFSPDDHEALGEFVAERTQSSVLTIPIHPQIEKLLKNSY